MNAQKREIPLREAVRKQGESLELEPERLAQLLHMQIRTAAQPTAPQRLSRPRRMALIAAFSVLVGALLGMFLNERTPSQTQAMLALIADEVAENHLALKPMELESGDLEAIRGYFTQLDFRPLETRRLAALDARVLGGRYCTLGGGIAAQLRVRPPEGGLRTLYQTRYDPERFGPVPSLDRGKPPARRMARGMPVTIWVERGVLFALTGD